MSLLTVVTSTIRHFFFESDEIIELDGLTVRFRIVKKREKPVSSFLLLLLDGLKSSDECCWWFYWELLSFVAFGRFMRDQAPTIYSERAGYNSTKHDDHVFSFFPVRKRQSYMPLVETFRSKRRAKEGEEPVGVEGSRPRLEGSVNKWLDSTDDNACVLRLFNRTNVSALLHPWMRYIKGQPCWAQWNKLKRWKPAAGSHLLPSCSRRNTKLRTFPPNNPPHRYFVKNLVLFQEIRFINFFSRTNGSSSKSKSLNFDLILLPI